MTAYPKPARGSSKLALRESRATAAKELAEAYDVANVRDGNRSRVSGRWLSPSSPDARTRREHHHLEGRNVAPDRVTDPSNIILVSSEEHQLIEGGYLQVEGTDANQRIVPHWNRDLMPKGKEPFKLLSKRWSENEEA